MFITVNAQNAAQAHRKIVLVMTKTRYWNKDGFTTFSLEPSVRMIVVDQCEKATYKIIES